MKSFHKESTHEAAEILTAACHLTALEAGWWKNIKGIDIRENELTFSNKLLLIITEVAEACEGDRKGLMDDKLPHRPMREVELADAVIRIFDLAGGFDLDLAGAIIEKMEFNASRADHKPENRAQAGGKLY